MSLIIKKFDHGLYVKTDLCDLVQALKFHESNISIEILEFYAHNRINEVQIVLKDVQHINKTSIFIEFIVELKKNNFFITEIDCLLNNKIQIYSHDEGYLFFFHKNEFNYSKIKEFYMSLSNFLKV